MSLKFLPLVTKLCDLIIDILPDTFFEILANSFTRPFLFGSPKARQVPSKFVKITASLFQKRATKGIQVQSACSIKNHEGTYS